MNRSTVVKRVLKLAALAACGVTRVGAAAPSREYDLGWTITVEGVPAGAQEARAWIAIPQELPEQRVSGLEVDTGLRWTIVQDATFHNKVVLVDVPRPPSPIRVKLRAHVVRDAIEGPRRAKLDARA